jgi:hypothetical protein
MEYKLEFWNQNQRNEYKDVIDVITGNVLFPYSLNIKNIMYFVADIDIDESEITEEIENSRGIQYTSYLKSEKYTIFTLVVSSYQYDVLVTLNYHSHIYLYDSDGNEDRIERVKIEEIENFEGFKKIKLSILTENSRLVISSNVN